MSYVIGYVISIRCMVYKSLFINKLLQTVSTRLRNMKLFGPLFLIRTRRIPQEPVPFHAITPLKLKPILSGKGDKSSEVCCIQEMLVMLSCLKKNEFNQPMCSREIESFQECYAKNIEVKNLRKERDLKGILTPGEKKLSSKRLNILLKKYPNLQ